MKIKKRLSGYIFRVIIIERTLEYAERTIRRHSSDVCREPLRSIIADNSPTEELEEIFGVKILFHHSFTEQLLVDDLDMPDFFLDLGRA